MAVGSQAKLHRGGLPGSLAQRCAAGRVDAVKQTLDDRSGLVAIRDLLRSEFLYNIHFTSLKIREVRLSCLKYSNK